MLDLRLFFDPKALNEPVSPWLRWPLTLVLDAGCGLCLALAMDTVLHWNDRGHPAFYLAVLTAVGIGSAAVALKLSRDGRIVGPVQGPPRPFVVRILGALVFSICSVVALLSEGWVERIELGAMALGGWAWLIWPARFFPPREQHGA